MIKKVMLSIMMVTAVTLFMVSCDNAANSANASKAASSTVKQEDCYGTWEGTMTVKMPNKDPTTQSLSIKVAKDSVDSGGNYGAYTKVLWGKNEDNKYFVAAQSDSTNTKNGSLTLENYTTAASCIIVFNGDGTATYSVPAMAAMGGTATLTKTN